MKNNRKTELVFWGGFFLLQFLLFLPAFFANVNHHDFIPTAIFQEKSLVQIAKGLLYNRTNLDPFRWNIEWSVLLFAAYFFNRWRPLKSLGWHLFFFFFYLLLLVYQIYHQSFYAIYQTPPFFYNDWGLLKVGWNIFIHDFNGRSLALVFVAIAFLFLCYKSIGKIVKYICNHTFSKASLFLMLFMIGESLVILFRWGYQAWPEHVLQFQVAPIIKNVRESIEANREMKALNISALAEHQPYDSIRLNQQPNFFFLFVESYGRVVYDDKVLQKEYATTAKRLEQDLQREGWQSQSILSTAPVSGGASWVSYSTFLDGFDFRNRGTYWALLNDTLFHQYQHFPRLLQSKGYRNYRLSAIGGSEDIEIPWDTYTRFYAVDEWIKFEDFNYQGLLYGWGPSPPDQFSLYFANQHIRSQRGNDPFTLFFITQNSHNPFLCPDTISGNWQWLNDSSVDQDQDSRIFEKPNLTNYSKAIKYQLEFIVDFILKEGQANDIFIIVGDHQPPLFPKPGAGFETPLHIIAKDSTFIHSFSEQHFTTGLYLSDTSKTIKHQGFYSLLLRHLQKTYGDPLQATPEYFPNGVKMERKVE